MPCILPLTARKRVLCFYECPWQVEFRGCIDFNACFIDYHTSTVPLTDADLARGQVGNREPKKSGGTRCSRSLPSYIAAAPFRFPPVSFIISLTCGLGRVGAWGDRHRDLESRRERSQELHAEAQPDQGCHAEVHHGGTRDERKTAFGKAQHVSRSFVD